MIAIAVLRARVAPVLDWCSRFEIYPEAAGEEADGAEIVFENSRCHEILKHLRDRGVMSVICGALTRELLDYAENLGIQVIYGVAGAVPEILQAYRTEALDRPQYWLPGCRGPCRYRRGRLNGGVSNARESEKNIGDATGQWSRGTEDPGGRGCARSSEKATGSNGPRAARGGVQQRECLCPRCGMEVVHQRGIPCAQVSCPQCGQSMRRK